MQQKMVPCEINHSPLSATKVCNKNSLTFSFALFDFLAIAVEF